MSKSLSTPMRPMRVLGMLSGTSADAIDVALAQIDDDDQGHAHMHTLGHAELPWPDGLRDQILAALPPARVDLLQVCALHTRLGQAFAGAAATAVDRWGPVDLIASHGQTLAHWVEHDTALGTLQLGAPAWITAATGVPVISDLRTPDVAAGGHGAPLASTLDALWLADQPTTVINIGGIANLTVLAGSEVVTGDTGPGNCLIDAAMQHHHGVRYDDGGRVAASGTVDHDALQVLLADPFYQVAMPRSTGREHFDTGYVSHTLRRAGVPVPAGADLITTLTELTARTIADAVRAAVGLDPARAPRRVVVSGGGAANPTLLRMLGVHLPGVRSSTRMGLPAQAKEGYLFALLGYLAARGLPGTVAAATPGPHDGPGRRQATGAPHPVVLGSLTPPAPALCPPGTTPIRRLTID